MYTPVKAILPPDILSSTLKSCLMLLCNLTTSLLSPHPQVIPNPLSVTIDEFTFSRILCQWNNIVQYFCLVSFFNIMILRLIYVVVCISSSLFYADYYSIIQMTYHSLFINSSVDRHLNCVQFLILQMKMVFTFAYKSQCGYLFLFLLVYTLKQDG